MTSRSLIRPLLGLTVFAQVSITGVIALGSGAADFEARVAPFLEAHCTKCHGPEKRKGGIDVRALGGDLTSGGESELETWELILDMLEGGEMPPDDEPQPSEVDRASVAEWIEAELRRSIIGGDAPDEAEVPTARRLTNFEYHNTMRDLLGFELNLTDTLPEDPAKPYHFNNTAEFMMLGMEQFDRYEANARRAMASAIVDPGEPEVHVTRREYDSTLWDLAGMGRDEISITGNRNQTVANGMRVDKWPETGEFRVRVQAAAILPEGYTEVPLRLVMGYTIVGIGADGATQVEPVGTVTLTNRVDEPEVFEFRGRIENYPKVPERRSRAGGKIDGALRITPPHMTITPLNLFDDGTLNDGPDPMARPRTVVNWIEFEAPVTDVWPPEHHTQILFDSPLRESDPDAYVRAVLERFMTRAFRRPVQSEEIDQYARIYRIVSKELGLETLEEAMRETLAMVLLSPNFMYHTAAVDGEEHHYQVASRLSYFLWGSMPDEELFELAAAGRLRDPEVIGEQARRLLADERSHDFVRNFTTQWLSIDKAATVPINLQLFPRFLYTITAGERAGREVPNRPTIRDYMLEESAAFVAELIDRNASLFNIVDSDFAMLNQPLAAHYGVEGVVGNELRPVALRPEHRLGGVLTHGSVLVGNGTGTAPHPIYRAVWLREAILGDDVGDPPADVPALSDSAGDSAEKATRIKDLLRLHRQKESCNDCHARLDPWGIPFERYNAIGRYEPAAPPEGARIERFNADKHGDLDGYRAYVESVSTVEVDASAKLPNGPEVDGLADLKGYLLEARRDDIAENLVRRLLTYSLGRELDYRDRYAVAGLLARAEEQGYGLQDLIVSICQSELFLNPPKS